MTIGSSLALLVITYDMNSTIAHAAEFVAAHRIRVVLVALAVLYGGYAVYGALTVSGDVPRYQTAFAAKETLIVSVSGTGQVSASNQIDLKPKASGDVISVPVIQGQLLAAGQVIAILDAREAQRSVRDAEANLESARIAYEKLLQPADELSLTQSEHALARARESRAAAEADLVKDYEDGFNSIANAFLDLPGVIQGLYDVLFVVGSEMGNQQALDFYASTAERYDARAPLYRTDAYAKYNAAKASYDAAFTAYKNANRFSDRGTIEDLVSRSYDATLATAEAVKSANNLIQFYQDRLTEKNLKPINAATAHLVSLNTYTGKTNTHLTALLSGKTTIVDDKVAIVNAERAIVEQTQSLAKLKAGADALDIRSSQLSVTQRENALQDAKEKLADYTVRAPFSGVLATLSVKRGDAVTSGTALAKMITTQQHAVIQLNEVDVAKVKVGQKATLSFDAVEDLALVGKVSEVAAIGTVTQGVVSYDVIVGFDAEDERVKPGMSVSAAIVTDVKTDILAVPSSAVKSDGTTQYVEVFAPMLADSESAQGAPSATVPSRKTVATGASNDTMIEIVAGLSESDQVVVRTISANTSASTQAAPSLFGGGGGIRMIR